MSRAAGMPAQSPLDTLRNNKLINGYGHGILWDGSNPVNTRLVFRSYF